MRASGAARDGVEQWALPVGSAVKMMQGSKAHIRAQHQEEPCGPEEEQLFFKWAAISVLRGIRKLGVWEAIHWLKIKIKNKF